MIDTAEDGATGGSAQNTREVGTQSRARQLTVVLFTLLMLALGVVHMFAIRLCGVTPTFDKALFGIAVIAVLPWLAVLVPGLIERVQSVSALGVEIKLVQKELERQSGVLQEQQQLLNRLTVFSVEDDIFDTLENLQQPKSFTYNANWPLLVRQFEFLFQRGYLSKGPDELEDNQEVGSGQIVTDLGREYIKLRRMMAATGRPRI